MSGSMVERVARELWLAATSFEGKETFWDNMKDFDRESYMIGARAAIEAMREPTPEMVEVAQNMSVFARCDYDGNYAELLPDVEGGSGGIQTLWRAQITAALGRGE